MPDKKTRTNTLVKTKASYVVDGKKLPLYQLPDKAELNPTIHLPVFTADGLLVLPLEDLFPKEAQFIPDFSQVGFGQRLLDRFMPGYGFFHEPTGMRFRFEESKLNRTYQQWWAMNLSRQTPFLQYLDFLIQWQPNESILLKVNLGQTVNGGDNRPTILTVVAGGVAANINVAPLSFRHFYISVMAPATVHAQRIQLALDPKFNHEFAFATIGHIEMWDSIFAPPLPPTF